MQNPRYHHLLIFLLHFVSLLSFSHHINCEDESSSSTMKVDIGVILDLETTVAKVMHTCILLALEDHHKASTSDIRIVPHIRDSKKDDVEAASAAIYLLKDVQVQAIYGPQMSTQTDFVIDLGNRVKVPIFSPATSPLLSPKENPSFIRGALPSSTQTKAIASIVKTFGWREVVIIYEDSNYGTGIVPPLIDALLEISTSVSYRSVISPSATDDQILSELYKLSTSQSRVFIVHLLPSLASRFFVKAKEAGMMRKGYAWIITDVVTGVLDTIDASVIESSMQGVLGVKPYIPKSYELNNFTRRWRKIFRQEYPDTDTVELNIFGLWAYDSVTALAKAIEKVSTVIPKFKKDDTPRKNLTDLDSLGTSVWGPLLLESVRNITLKTGLSGDFRIIDGELQSSPFEIVNIIGKGERGIGFWAENDGILRKLKTNGKANNKNDGLGAIIWPGESTDAPKGWEIPTSGNKLRVGVPVKGGLEQFVKVERDPETKAVTVTGFCVDVFKEVMLTLPYGVQYDFIPFVIPESLTLPDYDDLVYQVFLQKYDAVVGDVTIISNRSKYVDFTLPYTESGISAVVPVRDDKKNAWIFLKPLTRDLWITTGAFFVFIGFVVWVLEHRVNKEFRGPKRKQVGMIFWFSFSTLVFAHRERITSNLSRFVVLVWIFVVLVLTSSYTASLTSMLTVQKLQPTITDLSDIIKNGEYVGYQSGSFVDGVLQRMKFDRSKFRSYNTLEEYNDALLKGSSNGGVSAIVDELPYLRLFLAKYCRKYIMVGPTYKTAGFGFAFPRGSPLVPDVSRAVLKVMEGEFMINTLQKWFGNETNCPEQDGMAITSDSLTLDSFKGLFLIAGVSAASALVISVLVFLYQNRDILTSEGSIIQKLSAIAKVFDEERENSNPKTSEKPCQGNESQATATLVAASAVSPDILPDHLHPQSPEFIISYSAGAYTHDEGFSTTEPGSPVHDTVAITETTIQER